MLKELITPLNIHLSLNFGWLDIAEVLVIIGFLYAVYRKFIKNTQAEKLVRGMLFLVFMWALS